MCPSMLEHRAVDHDLDEAPGSERSNVALDPRNNPNLASFSIITWSIRLLNGFDNAQSQHGPRSLYQ